MAYELPALPYPKDALEPHIDAMTMEIHHGKHHAAYVTNLNKAIEGTEWNNKSIEDILANVSKLPPAVRNNGGGHWNHSAFWNWMISRRVFTPISLRPCIRRNCWMRRQFSRRRASRPTGLNGNCCCDLMKSPNPRWQN